MGSTFLTCSLIRTLATICASMAPAGSRLHLWLNTPTACEMQLMAWAVAREVAPCQRYVAVSTEFGAGRPPDSCVSLLNARGHSKEGSAMVYAAIDSLADRGLAAWERRAFGPAFDSGRRTRGGSS